MRSCRMSHHTLRPLESENGDIATRGAIPSENPISVPGQRVPTERPYDTQNYKITTQVLFKVS